MKPTLKGLLALLLELARIAGPLVYLDAVVPADVVWLVIGFPLVIGLSIALFRAALGLERSTRDEL